MEKLTGILFSRNDVETLIIMLETAGEMITNNNPSGQQARACYPLLTMIKRLKAVLADGESR